MIYAVKLCFWTSPVEIEARNEEIAAGKALIEFPTCDCCVEKTAVEWVRKVQ